MTFFFAYWKPLALAIVFGGLVVWGTLYKHRYEAVEREYVAFQATTKALGEVAEKQARAKEKTDLQTKEKIDAENRTLRVNLAAESKRVRDFNTNSGGLSGIPANPDRPDVACFNRSELDTAIRRYQSDLLGIAEKGAQATLDLNGAKSWASQVK